MGDGFSSRLAGGGAFGAFALCCQQQAQVDQCSFIEVYFCITENECPGNAIEGNEGHQIVCYPQSDKQIWHNAYTGHHPHAQAAEKR